MKMATVLESVSCSGNLPGKTNNTTVTATCTPQEAQVQSTGEARCHSGLISADSFSVQPCHNRLEVHANLASCEAVPTAGAAKKKKKTVTFSDNVELVASAGDVADPVDYMSYATSIGRQANASCTAVTSGMDPSPTTVNGVDIPSNCSRDCDDGSDETDVGRSVTPTGQVRCSLCRQKWIALTDTYCSDCSFYLSKLEISN